MGRGKSAYVLKIVSDLKGSELEAKIEEAILKNVINDQLPKKSQKGFIDLNIKNGNYINSPKFYFSHLNNGKSIARYREYKEEFDKYNDELNYRPIDIGLLYDGNKRHLIILTSALNNIFKIMSLFDYQKDYFKFRLPTYAKNEYFFRWVIENSKDQKKFPNPCKLKNIEYVSVKDLTNSKNHPSTESVNLRCLDHMCDNEIYLEIKDEGKRNCLKGEFEHSKWFYDITIYADGKITLGRQPSETSENDFLGMFSVALEEMEHIHKAYLEDMGN